MRCPVCNKFVSFEADPTVELESLDVMDNAVVANTTIQLCCAECGETLRQAELLTEVEITPEEHTCEDFVECPEDADEPYSLDDLYVSSEEGNPEPTVRIVNGKSFYGFRLETYVRCKCCGTDLTMILKDDTSSSNFDDAV